jgi:hypothetical protein
LRKLAAGHAFYEIGEQPRGRWDTFATRNLGFAAQRHMAANFGGDPSAFRRAARASLARVLDVDLGGTRAQESAFENFAVLLSLVPEVERWTTAQRQALIDIIRAKTAAHEAGYLHLLQRHDALRESLLRLGSAPISAHANSVHA